MELLTHLYNLSPRILQNVGINLIELKERRIRNSKKFLNYLKLLRETEKWKREEFADYQNKRLRHIIEYAYKNVPFYHDLYNQNRVDISQIKSIEDLERIPTISKNDILNNWKLLQSNLKERFITHRTSGTTGKPLTINISYDLSVLNKVSAYRRDLWAGYSGEWIARLVGDSPARRDCKEKVLFRKSYVMKRAIFPSYCLNLDRLGYIKDEIKKINIGFLQCYPSTGYILAKYLEMIDEYLPLKGILYSSEPVFSHQRTLMEERFDTELFGYYGQAEGVVSAAECENHEYHLTMVDGILEIGKDGIMASPGEKGLTIATSLNNYKMPLIRYELEDFTGHKDEECTCGRNMPVIYPIETRLDDFVFTPDGRIVTPQLMDLPLRYTQNIIETQIVQKSLDSILVRIRKNEHYNQNDELKVIDIYKELLGKEMHINIEYVDKIYQTGNFKKKIVISELGKDFAKSFFAA